MPLIRPHLLALLALAWWLPGAGVQAQPSKPVATADMPRYHLRESHADTGTTLLQMKMRDSLIPFDQPYSGLSPQQQALIKDQYEPMAEGDEPPYPRDGLRAVVDAVLKVADYTRDSGVVTLHLEINPQGGVHAVRVLQSPDMEFSKLVAREMVDLPFKPAVCQGRPCRMAYLVNYNITRRLR